MKTSSRLTVLASSLFLTFEPGAVLGQDSSPLTLDLGHGVTITPYGYIKADAIWDDGFDLGGTTSGLKNIGLPAGGPPGSYNRQQLNDTRIGFDVRGPDNLFARFEGDFFGANDSLRLRHAYIDWYGFMVGQNWTNFMSVENIADTVDLQTSLGYPLARLPQVRYTFQGWGNTSLSASVEQDKSNSSDLAYTLALRHGLNNGMVRVSGLWRDTTISGAVVEGWGLNFSTVLGLWQGGKLKANFTTGEGIADIINAGLTGNALTIGGNAVGVNSAALTVTQQVNPKLKLAATVDWMNVNQAFGTDTDRLTSMHLSAFFTLRKNTTLMAEYFTVNRTQGNGASFDSDRLQLAVKYAF